jgi:hypothetical protein
VFVSDGDKNLRFWTIDGRNRKLKAENGKLDTVKRITTCLQLDESDQLVFCGTTTGDVLKVSMSNKLLMTGPKKMLGEGITSLQVAPWGDIAVGSGCGIVVALDDKDLKVLRSVTLNGRLMSTSMVAVHLETDLTARCIRLSCSNGRPN